MKKSRVDWILFIIFLVLALAINAYIIYHACLNGAKSSAASEGVVEVSENVVNTVKPNTITEANHDSFATFIRKAFGHFGLFVISGFFTSLAVFLLLNMTSSSQHYINAVIGLSLGLLLAIITETIQLFVEGRSGEITDILIDFSGYLLGALIVGLVLFIVIRNRNKKAQQVTSAQ